MADAVVIASGRKANAFPRPLSDRLRLVVDLRALPAGVANCEARTPNARKTLSAEVGSNDSVAPPY